MKSGDTIDAINPRHNNDSVNRMHASREIVSCLGALNYNHILSSRTDSPARCRLRKATGSQGARTASIDFTLMVDLSLCWASLGACSTQPQVYLGTIRIKLASLSSYYYIYFYSSVIHLDRLAII